LTKTNLNRFIEKYKSKTNQELLKILENKEFVIDAKNAAAQILESRNQEFEYTEEAPKSHPKSINQTENKKKKSSKEDKEWNIYHEIRLLVLGIATILGALWIISPTIFTFQSSLKPVEGELIYVNNIVENVSARSRYGYKAKSRKASLSFKITGANQIFRLHKNIGQNYYDEKFNKIESQLKKANTVSVWIKKSQIDDPEPKVFKIHANDNLVLAFKDVKTEHSWIFVFLLILGSLCTYIALRRKKKRKLLTRNIYL